jgi:hypothetical protein
MTSHPELPGIKSVEVMDPGIESLEVVALLPASNPSPRLAAGGNSTLKASSTEVPRLPESVEAAPHDHLALVVVLCPNDQQRTSSTMPRQVHSKAFQILATVRFR